MKFHSKAPPIFNLLPEADSFAALRSSYACWLCISSFCELDKLLSKVSFICFKIPKMAPDLRVQGSAKKHFPLLTRIEVSQRLESKQEAHCGA